MAETTTRRKPGPPKTKDYTTVSLKIATTLLARVKSYAGQRQLSVSELFKDGVEWRIGEGDALTQRYATGASRAQDASGNTEIQDWRQRETENSNVLQEIRTALARQETQLQALAHVLEQRAVVSTPPVASGKTIPTSPGQDSASEPAPGKQRRQSAEARHADNGNSVLQSDVPPFDTTKYVLGKLCPRGHDEYGPGQSLRSRTHGRCLACDREKARAQRQAKQPPSVVEQAQTKTALLAQLHRWQHDEGLGPQAIAERLNANQEPTFSGRGQWSRGTVSKLLAQQAHS